MSENFWLRILVIFAWERLQLRIELNYCVNRPKSLLNRLQLLYDGDYCWLEVDKGVDKNCDMAGDLRVQ